MRDRKRPDVLALLAQARPSSLDAVSPAVGMRPEAVAAGIAAAAGPAPGTAAPPRQARRVRWALASGGLMLAVAVTVAAAVVAAPGGPDQGRSAPPVSLTAAEVREVASTSRSALAHAGRAVIVSRQYVNGALQGSDADTVTFSGRDWNDVISQSFPSGPGQRRTSQFAVNRIVDGQAYYYIAGQTRRHEWYHDTNPAGHPQINIPDPRTVLGMLAPSARFVVVGHHTVGGVRLTILRATDLRRLPALRGLPGVSHAGRVTSLRVWVDRRHVVHRLALTVRQVSMAPRLELRHLRSGKLVILAPDAALLPMARAIAARSRTPGVSVRLDPRLGPGRRREVQVTMLSVLFSEIGRPQAISVPRHAIMVYGRG